MDKKQELKEELSKKVTEIGQSFKHSPEQLEEYISFASRFRQYSHKNLMMIYAQRPFASFIASASAWFKGLPNDKGEPLSNQPIYIKKGEKAINIWCPVNVNKYSKDGLIWKTVYQLSEEAQKSIREHPEQWNVKKELHFKLVPVFDVGQTECPKELIPRLIGLGTSDATSAQMYNVMCEYCEKTLGIPVEEKDFGSIVLRGGYTPSTHSIEINNLLEDTQKLSTLLHEIGHSQLHSLQSIQSKSLPQIELEADMYSLLLEKLCGLETTDARKAHLAEQYKDFIEAQEKLPSDKRITVDQVFDAVFSRYQQTLPDVQSVLNKTINSPEKYQYQDLQFAKHPSLKVTKI